ncbi:hypothetical protein GCM10009802_35410 [Streptomyces synnematoformans]|uniref:Uncharacterized protein n=2 Tax=Streptomyces synnematoformans TaxID=415721 RepID=A0ABN2YJY4_9ACTN
MQLALGTVLALALGLGAALLGTAAPAGAALTGSVTLTPSSGDLSTAPMFDEVTVDGACPDTHKEKAHILVLRPDSSVAGALAVQVTDGAPYGEAPFTIGMPDTANSLGGLLGADPADGVYQIDIRCLNGVGNYVAGNNFLLPITVTGDTWEVGSPDAVKTTIELSAEPAKQVVVNKPYKLIAKVTPADAEGHVEFDYQNRKTAVELRNGTAELEQSAGTASGSIPYVARFVPDNIADFKGSSDTLTYFKVLEPTILVQAENGDALQENAQLEGGQKVLVTAGGFRADEAVQVTIPDSGGEFADVAADAEGSVTEHEVTIPEDIADGEYTLSFTGADSGVKLDFPFMIGEGGGDNGGGDSDGGDSDGGDNGGGSGGAGGAAGGAGGGAGGGTGGSGGGSDLPLASTGSSALDLAVVSVLLMTGGAGAVYWAHRSGRLLTFGATPRA